MTACAREMASSLPAILGVLAVLAAVTSVAALTTLTTFPEALEDWIIRGLNPDFLAALADPLIFAGVEFAAAELGPELTIFRASGVIRLDEHAVMLAFDFLEIVAKRATEVLVGGDDFPIRLELDDRHRTAESCESALGVAAEACVKHHNDPLSFAERIATRT